MLTWLPSLPPSPPPTTPALPKKESKKKAHVAQVCLFSYGQTGAGKTHTMQGSKAGQDRGIIPRAILKVPYPPLFSCYALHPLSYLLPMLLCNDMQRLEL